MTFQTTPDANLTDEQKIKWYENQLNKKIDEWEILNPENLEPEPLSIKVAYYKKFLETNKNVLQHQQSQITTPPPNAVKNPDEGRL